MKREIIINVRVIYKTNAYKLRKKLNWRFHNSEFKQTRGYNEVVIKQRAEYCTSLYFDYFFITFLLLCDYVMFYLMTFILLLLLSLTQMCNPLLYTLMGNPTL